jgi:hypothetical protein
MFHVALYYSVLSGVASASLVKGIASAVTMIQLVVKCKEELASSVSTSSWDCNLETDSSTPWETKDQSAPISA